MTSILAAALLAAASLTGVAALDAEAPRNGGGGPIASGATQDARNPDAYTVGVRQAGLDAWYAAFGVTPGQKLYLPPDQRGRIR